MPWKSNRRVLTVADQPPSQGLGLSFHEVLHTKRLKTVAELLRQSHPDLIVYFTKDKGQNLEDYVLSWLIAGFRGRILLFDTHNRVRDHEALTQSQVIDEYYAGPVSQARLLTILKSHLSQDLRFASPRAMTTFDLFRNLFDRALNGIFLFNEEMSRCVAANLQAERLCGRSFEELDEVGLKELCGKKEFEERLAPMIRKAARSYYDTKGKVLLKTAEGESRPVTFSCGVFDFGRKKFVKLEVQAAEKGVPREPSLARRREKPALFSGFHPHA